MLGSFIIYAERISTTEMLGSFIIYAERISINEMLGSISLIAVLVIFAKPS